MYIPLYLAILPINWQDPNLSREKAAVILRIVYEFNGDIRVLGGARAFSVAVRKCSGSTTSPQEVQSLLTVQSLLAGQLLLVCQLRF